MNYPTKGFRIAILTFSLFFCHYYCQARFVLGGGTKDSVMKISIGGGMQFSTINMRMEPIAQLKSGWNARIGFRFKSRAGITAEYTSHFVHSAEPAWINIKSSNFDLNFTYLYFNVSDSYTKFYALTGVCLQKWNGLYRGPAAVNQDNLDYTVGDHASFNWTSLNLGIGFERYYRYFGLFSEFKFRFGKNYPSDPFGIVDVGGTFGAKINLVSIGGPSKSHEQGPSKTRRRGFRIKPKIYHWF
jgi:hypothetical protein